jgi:hypothetical protein
MGFPNLPGVTVNLNDLGLKIAPPPAGPKVTLLGITSNTELPLNEPLTVTNISQVTSSLWYAPTGSSLADSASRYPGELAIAVEEAVSAGAPNIEIVVIAHVSGANDLDKWTNPRLTQLTRLTALSGAYDAIQNRDLDVVVPVGAYIDFTGQDYGTQLANFCYQATTEVDNACQGVISMMPVTTWAYHHGATNLGLTGFSLREEVASINSGSDLKFGLPSLALVNEWTRYVAQDLGAAVYGADLSASWKNYLSGSESELGTYYPGTNENAATSVNSAYFNSWQAQKLDGSYDVDNNGNKVDVGARISVVGAPLVTNTRQIRQLAKGLGASLNQTVHTTDGAAAYAGFMASRAPQSSPTNKRIPNLAGQRPLSAAQANKIAGRRIVTFHSRANGFVVTNAMTGAHNVSKWVRSDYVRLTTVRVVDAIVDLVRSVAERYIGEPNSAAQRNALGNEIDKFLKQMRVAGAINGFKFFISATPDQQVLGEATIDLTIVPPFEILNITTNINLAKSITG